MKQLIIILFSFSILSFSQDEKTQDSKQSRRSIRPEELKKGIEYPFFFGVFGGATLIQSEMSLPIIPLADDCGEYSEGSGQDIYLGLEVGGSLFVKWLSNDIRFWYEGRPVTLQTQSTGPNVLSSNGEYVNFIRDHEYNAYLNYLAIDIGVRIRPLEAIDWYFGTDWHRLVPFYLRASYSASDPMFDATFDNYQYVNSPNNVTFPNGRIDQLVAEGDLQGGRTTSALNFEIGASWKITNDINIAPQLSYRYELQAPYEQYDWSYQIFRAGVSIQFHQNRDYFEPRRPEPIKWEKEKEEEKPAKIAKVEKKKNAKNIEEKKIESEELIETKNIEEFIVNPLNITETVVTQTYPILPYIFFDNRSTKIPERYKRDPNNFSEEELPKETIGIYYNVLDIIGNRLEENPETEIKLIGTSDGIEAEGDDALKLSANRANNIKNYLINKWDISPARLKTEASILPKLATSMVYEEGAAENRRVEIISDDPEILKPISHSRFLEYKTNPKALEYPVKLSENPDIISGSVSLFVDGEKLYSDHLAGNPGTEHTFKFPERILNEISQKMKNGDKLIAQLKLEKRGEKSEIIEKEIPYSSQRNKFEVGRLNLIVFDFDKATISDQNKEMIKTFLASSIQDNSKTTVTGSTDRLGEAKYNKELSQKRANSVANFIKQFKPNYSFEKVKGIGSSNLAFDNNSPEGRFYCRTVLVEVKTPIE